LDPVVSTIVGVAAGVLSSVVVSFILAKSARKRIAARELIENGVALLKQGREMMDPKMLSAAIKSFENASASGALRHNSPEFVMLQNYLGIAYGTLAEVEDKAANCRNAIRAFELALKVRTLEKFPMDFAMTQNNLGNAYTTLAEVEDKAANCRNAIRAFELALKVYTLEKFPMDFAMTQNNLGAAYRTLAEVEDKAANCKRAKEAYNRALEVSQRLNLKEMVSGVQRNLARLQKFCDMPPA